MRMQWRGPAIMRRRAAQSTSPKGVAASGARPGARIRGRRRCAGKRTGEGSGSPCTTFVTHGSPRAARSDSFLASMTQGLMARATSSLRGPGPNPADRPSLVCGRSFAIPDPEIWNPPQPPSLSGLPGALGVGLLLGDPWISSRYCRFRSRSRRARAASK